MTSLVKSIFLQQGYFLPKAKFPLYCHCIRVLIDIQSKCFEFKHWNTNNREVVGDFSTKAWGEPSLGKRFLKHNFQSPSLLRSFCCTLKWTNRAFHILHWRLGALRFIALPNIFLSDPSPIVSLSWTLFNFIKIAIRICESCSMYFLSSLCHAEVWPRFQYLSKLLTWFDLMRKQRNFDGLMFGIHCPSLFTLYQAFLSLI